MGLPTQRGTILIKKETRLLVPLEISLSVFHQDEALTFSTKAKNQSNTYSRPRSVPSDLVRGH